MHYDGEEIGLGTEPGDNLVLALPLNSFVTLADQSPSLSFTFFDYHTQGCTSSGLANMKHIRTDHKPP